MKKVDVPEVAKVTVKLSIEVDYELDGATTLVDVIDAAKELIDSGRNYGNVVRAEITNLPVDSKLTLI